MGIEHSHKINIITDDCMATLLAAEITQDGIRLDCSGITMSLEEFSFALEKLRAEVIDYCEAMSGSEGATIVEEGGDE